MDKYTMVSNDELAILTKKHEKTGATEPLEFGIVFYTDGGSRNNNAGYGVHGYLFCNTQSNVGCGVSGFTPTNYGYQIKDLMINPTVDNIKTGVQSEVELALVTPVKYLDIIGAVGEGSNNVAELQGLINALLLAKDYIENGFIKTIHFVLDSRYVINAVTAREKYIANNFVGSGGKPLANVELVRELYATLIPLTGYKVDMTIQWTKGHSDSFGNIQADKHASAGVVGAENGSKFDDVKVSNAHGHWKDLNESLNSTVPGLNLLLDYNWYDDSQFDLIVRGDGLVPIYLGTHTEPEKIGQADANTTKGVVLLKELPHHMRELRGYVRKLDAVFTTFEVRGPFFGVVNTLLKNNIVKQVTDHGEKLFTTDYNGKMIKTFENKELMTRISPCATSPKAFDDFDYLHRVLDKFLDGKLGEFDCVTDVTDHFYSTKISPKGKKDVKVLVGTEHSTTLNVNVTLPSIIGEAITKPMPLILNMGITAPKRRVIASIKDLEPKLSIVARYEEHIGFRHFFIVQINTGEAGIWTNVDANLRVF